MTILELLDHLEIPFKRSGESPHVTQDWYGVICPYCGIGTDKYGMGIHPSGAVKCWKCGSHRLGDVLAALSNKGLHEVLPFVNRVKIGARPHSDPQVGSGGKLTLPSGLEPISRNARAYLRSRGYVPKTLERLWGLKSIGLAPKLAWRLYIPIRQYSKTVSWTTRALCEDASPRYVNAKPEQEAVPIKSLLYGAEHAGHSIIVVEGPFDVWKIGPGAVATLGVNYTRSQLAAIAAYPSRAVCFDNEPIAQQQARRLCAELAAFPGQTHCVEIDAKDPGEASPKEVRQIRKAFLDV